MQILLNEIPPSCFNFMTENLMYILFISVQYGLSHSNHVDSASLPPNKSVWSTKTGLAELFSALGLSKYTDLFTQQEVC